MFKGIHHRSFHYHPLIYSRMVWIFYWFLACPWVLFKIIFLIFFKC
nr:MAG TPA: hypothetical protein [Caudoviricetes sp.]